MSTRFRFRVDNKFPIVLVAPSVRSQMAPNQLRDFIKVELLAARNNLTPGGQIKLRLRGPARGIAGLQAVDERLSYLVATAVGRAMME